MILKYSLTGALVFLLVSIQSMSGANENRDRRHEIIKIGEALANAKYSSQLEAAEKKMQYQNMRSLGIEALEAGAVVLAFPGAIYMMDKVSGDKAKEFGVLLLFVSFAGCVILKTILSSVQDKDRFKNHNNMKFLLYYNMLDALKKQELLEVIKHDSDAKIFADYNNLCTYADSAEVNKYFGIEIVEG